MHKKTIILSIVIISMLAFTNAEINNTELLNSNSNPIDRDPIITAKHPVNRPMLQSELDRF